MTGALGLALGAAFLHALWNVLVAGAEDSEAATAVAAVCGTLALAPLAIATGGVETAALPYAGASAALELAYLALLARGYRHGQLSVVYPVARGSAPVLVLVAGALVAGEGASGVEAAGVVVVAVGVFLVAGDRATGWARRDVAFGLAVGAVIAAYTLVDAEGVERAEPAAYLALVLAPPALAYAGGLAVAGRGAALRGALSPRIAGAGVLMVGAYGLVLAALQLAPAAPVAAVRESSVVIAALLAAAMLRERVSRARLAGAAAVACGVAAIALG